MKEPYPFNKFDKQIYSFLNYFVFFAWLIPIWSPIYKMELSLTWVGCLFLGLIMTSMQKDNEKARRNLSKERKNGRE